MLILFRHVVSGPKEVYIHLFAFPLYDDLFAKLGFLIVVVSLREELLFVSDLCAEADHLPVFNRVLSRGWLGLSVRQHGVVFQHPCRLGFFLQRLLEILDASAELLEYGRRVALAWTLSEP